MTCCPTIRPHLRVLLIGLALGVGGARAEAGAEPPAPDYGRAEAWAATPERPGAADERPAGVAQAAGPRAAAVFFVHPTTDLAPVVGNAAFDAGGEVGRRIDGPVLSGQASVFNACCRLYAPRYRQASLRAVTSHTPAAQAAVELAYGDVARAFDAFLRREPELPFIVAGHSQGAIHVLRLLQQRIVGTPLQRRLVAAYAIGLSLPRQIDALGLPVCADAQATGCIVGWNSVRRGDDDRRRREDAVIWWQGRYEPIGGRPLVCVNPLDWRPDGTAAPDANLGAVYREADGRLSPPQPGLTGAWCESGLLGVAIAARERRHFSDPLTLFGIYHDFDVALFYMNLRANALQRVQAQAAR